MNEKQMNEKQKTAEHQNGFDFKSYSEKPKQICRNLPSGQFFNLGTNWTLIIFIAFQGISYMLYVFCWTFREPQCTYSLSHENSRTYMLTTKQSCAIIRLLVVVNITTHERNKKWKKH